ncbi:MAG: HNH endonuclease [Acidobacteria bacterium]|nr:HNH endonuclease [Acidobacteriota bacterium]
MIGSYAEVHHHEELAQGGLDVPSNMLCVCPSCHREVHYGVRRLVAADGEWGLEQPN